jgi:hypothetical protein
MLMVWFRASSHYCKLLCFNCDKKISVFLILCSMFVSIYIYIYMFFCNRIILYFVLDFLFVNMVLELKLFNEKLKEDLELKGF